ncbi:MAG: dTDP 4-dehydrorhamnose reductase [Candidatus Magasanikbacteria bacterium GW2011_GWE2_42_7]|uniref:dTDP-4-dehydrorhamnose reductase n=1 Tax=Candidatus Magasanikbacteria bacterium GW2011_GWE2_42_7 TaxID=1619052 RepID=A0A0G1BD09_9BACT|nr:MAG: dTDP 4-dehydrorhamnose reductase [Candidatus Magasanikbacteria bacterium GW2011_GWE2_42_7]
MVRLSFTLIFLSILLRYRYMKRLLLFGAKGTLGQAVAALFERDDTYTVIQIDKDDCDITDEHAVNALFEKEQPDMVINAAAVNAVDTIETDAAVYDLATEVNGIAPGRLALYAKEHGSVFVHYSTDYVFDGVQADGYAEDAAPHPLSRYAETKLLGETEVMKAEADAYIIRISRLFGKAGVGEGSKRSFVEPSYAPDVALFTKKVLEESYPFGIYHGANSGGCSWYGWAKEIFDIKNIDIDVSPVPASQFPRPAKAPMHSMLLNTKGPVQRRWQDALLAYLDTI